MTFIKALRAVIPASAIFTSEPMAKHTSFKIGGNADVMVKPTTTNEIESIFALCAKNKIPLTLLGEGSNVLVSDEGIRGVTLLTTSLNTLTVDAQANQIGYIKAGAGVRLAKLADTACKHNLQGLEFAQAIPGSVGGAVYMNAGAYDHDIAEVCVSVTILQNGKLVEIAGKDMGFDYRTSRVQSDGGVIVEAIFRLLPGNADDIRAEMARLNALRREKQPFEPSAGSTFKRPKGYFAGKLIQDAGLMGFKIGGAQVSKKHAGFVINAGDATADDVCNLMDTIRKRVFEMAGVWLEPEVEIIGRKYPWEQE